MVRVWVIVGITFIVRIGIMHLVIIMLSISANI